MYLKCHDNYIFPIVPVIIIAIVTMVQVILKRRRMNRVAVVLMESNERLYVENQYRSYEATSTISSDHSTLQSSSGSAILTDTVCNHES